MTKPRKRVLTIRLSPRDKKAPKAILKAVRFVVKQQEQFLRVVAVPDPTGEEVSLVTAAQEHLEASALHLAASVLDEKANEHAPAEEAARQAGKKRKPAEPG